MVSFILFVTGPVVFWWPFVTRLEGVWTWALAGPWVVGLVLPVILAHSWSLIRTAVAALVSALLGGLIGQVGVFASVVLRGGPPYDVAGWATIGAVQYWTLTWTLMGVFPVVIAVSALVIRERVARARAEQAHPADSAHEG